MVPGVLFSGINLKDLYKRGYVDLKMELDITNKNFKESGFVKNFYRFSVDDRGQIYIVDSRNCKIVILDKNGKYIKTFGQKGSGPGDLNLPGKIFIKETGPVVYEVVGKRFSFFNSAGNFIKVIKLNKFLFIVDLKPIAGGKYLLQTYDRKKSNGKIDQKAVISLYNKDFEKLKTVYSKKVFLHRYTKKGNRPQPFAPNISFDVNANGDVVAGYQGEDYISIIKGGNISRFKHMIDKKPVTEEEKEKYFDNMIFASRSGGYKKGADKEFRKMTVFPEFHPYYRSIKIDSEGNILVFNGEKSFYAYDRSGKLISKVQIKEGKVNPRTVSFRGSGKFYTSIINEEDDEEPHLIKYIIE